MTAFLHRNSIIGGGKSSGSPFAFMLRQPADVEKFLCSQALLCARRQFS